MQCLVISDGCGFITQMGWTSNKQTDSYHSLSNNNNTNSGVIEGKAKSKKWNWWIYIVDSITSIDENMDQPSASQYQGKTFLSMSYKKYHLYVNVKYGEFMCEANKWVWELALQ